MAKVLVLGGGFGGVVAAERLAQELGDEHQITLVSRTQRFVFFPALVRLAFGKCSPDDVSFNLRRTMLSRRVNFIEAEVARIDPVERKVSISHGDVEGKLAYDYLIFALGGRLATERITGFYENAHHLLNVDKALQFGKAVQQFHGGRAIIGQCPGARYPIPIFECAFFLSRFLEERNERQNARITIVSPDSSILEAGDSDVTSALKKALDYHRIEFVSDFPIEVVTPGAVITNQGDAINFNLLMLVPSFRGSPAASYLGVTDAESYINVDAAMRVIGLERVYAIGDCVNFGGPKMAHMAVRQAEVAAANLTAEIEGHEPFSRYNHEMRVVIDDGGRDSIYVHKDLWANGPASVSQGRFWSWAKRAQEQYWEVAHS